MHSADKEFFSKKVHKYIVYKDIKKSLDKYERRIINELEIRGLTKDFLKNRTIIDIGTGFQAITASKMGAKFIYHLDISDEQVLWMQQYCKEQGIDNIKSMQCDITKEIPILNEVDLVLVFGVWHHLDKPSEFIKNLIPALNKNNSFIWLRNYRSGTWSRWLVAQLRDIAKNIDTQVLEKILQTRYPQDIFNQWKGDMLDDLFAPIWQAFHPKQFEIKDISTIINKQSWEYNFNDYDENFRVDFHINRDNIEQFKSFIFPDVGVKQRLLKFEDENIKEIQSLFKKWQYKDEPMDIRANKLITLFELVRKKPIYDAYTDTNINDNDMLNSIDKDVRVGMLLKLLKLFVEDM